MVDLKTNVLYYGDNLDILREHIPDESIDLIYLDPPFNSNRSYNVLFRESGGAGSGAQIEAFEDTWQWGQAAQGAYEEVMTGPHQKVARMLQAMVDGLGHNDVTAYLSMMAIRLVELHRVLKSTGSFYLHCDPTTGHYLKMLVDAIFDPRNFLNEIIWKRSSAHSDRAQGSKHFGRVHDTLLVYAKSGRFAERPWNQLYERHAEDYIVSHYPYVETGTSRRYGLWDITGPGGASKGNPTYEVMGVTRYWRYSRERMDELIRAGRVVQPRPGAVPRYKRYLDEMEGTSLQDTWTDISPINSQAKERLGYPTQKPLALLERIVSASSNPGGIILDPFCGCGTAVHAAQKLGRRWIGIDITYLAINLIERRMIDAFPGLALEVEGAPRDLPSARDLAHRDKWQFQWWALTRLDAQPVAGKKKGSDKGIDGVIPFFAGPKEDYRRAIVSVKGGEHVNVMMVRDLKGVLEREKEPIGIFLTLAPPTKDMVTEAAAAGFYDSEFWGRKFPRLQIMTIEEVLGGKKPDMPWGKAPFAKAPTEKEKGEQEALL
jgi:DNA modification methylase